MYVAGSDGFTHDYKTLVHSVVCVYIICMSHYFTKMVNQLLSALTFCQAISKNVSYYQL